MTRPFRFSACLLMGVLCCAILWASPAAAQVAGPNVNMVSGTKWPTGDPFLQRQNEPSMAVSTRNPLHILAGSNDYRSVDLELVLSGGEETGDSWLGLFKSFDGGLTWQSTLLPGCPQLVSQCADSGALNGHYQAGADPVVRAGTNGMFYYAGLAFDRATSPTTASSASAIFVARYDDLNNNENQDPIAYIDTHIVATGNSTQFLDKPALAVDIPRSGATTCSFTASEPGAGANGGPLSVRQSFAAGNIYLTYTDFLAATKANTTPTHLMFTRSTDCGVTWSTPIQINTGTTTSQGSTIAVNAINGNVYVAWRQFASTGVRDAIMTAMSTNGGKTFGKPTQISTFQPFDQGTTGTSFRTNAYPSLTTDGFGFVYVAFSARGLGPNGDARVVAAGSLDGTHWTPAFMVDNPRQSATNPSGRGHQIMPAITFANGRLTLLYYDLRLDHYEGSYTPNTASSTGYTESLAPEGELAPPNPAPAEVFTNFIDDSGLRLRRHSIDLRTLELGIFPTIALGPSVLVSQYDYGCCVNPNSPDIEQFKFNVPNLPIFAQGMQPFLGDYIDVVPSPLFVPNGTSWAYNFQPSVNPLFHAAWTDNRDVVPPADGNWEHYTPPIPKGTPSVFQPGDTVTSCVVGQEGMRNQNIYTAQITGGLVVGAPGNAKPLGTTMFNNKAVPFQRGFAVEAQNVTGQPINVRFSIANQPTGGSASFLQFSVLTTLDVAIPAQSSVSRTVFVTSSNAQASVTVNVAQISGIGGSLVTNGLSSAAVLNPDLTNPAITNPAITNPAITNPAITNFEVTNPAITNPAITNPAITNPAITNPAITNPAITNPAITNPAITNPAITNVSATNPAITNPAITNPDVTNPAITNPAITNPAITNGSIQDVTYAIVNNGNTTSAYTVKLASNSVPPNGIVLQLILAKLYQTPGANNCTLAAETHWVTVANITNPKLFSATDPQLGSPDTTNPTPNEASVTLAPGETAYITLRVVNPTPATTPFNPLTAVVPVTVPQAVNTTTVLSNPPGNPPPNPPLVYPAPSILTASLPATDANHAGYLVQLQSAGGKPGPDTWSIASGSLPSGLTLSSTGLLAGTPAQTGSFPVTIKVADGASSSTTQSYTITVNAPFLLASSAPLPSGVVGLPYTALPWTTSGGTAPAVWSATGLPPGLSINPATGVISGTPTAANLAGFSAIITETDSAVPPAIISFAKTITIAPALTITTTTLPNGTVGVQYSATINTVGGVAPISFSLTQATFPPGLFITQPPTGTTFDTLAGIPTAAGTYSFSESVSDHSSPPQTATQTYTVTIVAPSANVTFASQPANSVGGQFLGGSPIVVHVADNTNAPIAAAQVTMSFHGTPPCSSATLSGTLTVQTDATGNATFTDLSVDRGQNGYALNAAVLGVSAVSNPFNVSGFCATNTLNTARDNHVAVTLTNGSVLTAGGNDTTGNPSSSAELYTPGLGFVPLSNMQSARSSFTGTLLATGPNAGSVLLAGGLNTSTSSASVEIFTPNANSFTLDPNSMSSPRFEHTATLLANGDVLIAGGSVSIGNDPPTAEIYHAADGTFSPAITMTSAHVGATATLLPNGKVLIAGGSKLIGSSETPIVTAELYDPATNTFTATGSLNVARGDHVAVLLPNGKVLVAGGVNVSNQAEGTAELYDPSTGAFTFTGSMVVRSSPSAALLPNGQVLVVGGTGSFGQTNQAQLYDPVSGSFSSIPPMISTRTVFPVAVLNDGTVLISGGFVAPNAIGNAEVYFPTAPAPMQVTTPATLPTGLVGVPYTQVLLEQGGLGPLNWQAVETPPGLNLSPNGMLTGTPAAPGAYNIPVQVSDSSPSPQTAPASLTVQIAAPLSFATTTLPNAPTDSGSPAIPYTAQLLTTGGAGGTMTFSVVSGALPPSITLNPSTGYLTSSSVTDPATTYNFTIQAVSAGPPSSTATQAYTLTLVPFFNGSTPNTLPGGTVGVPYATGINSTGGITPYTYQLASGQSTPPGLSLSTVSPTAAQLSGTPTASGTSTFFIQVSDSSAPPQVYYEALTITISPPPAGPVANLTFVSQPTQSIDDGPVVGTPGPSVRVLATDASSTPVPNATITIAYGNKPCSSAQLETAPPPTAVTDASGIASFFSLRTFTSGGNGYTLVASASTGATATSSSFNVTGYCSTATPNAAHSDGIAVALPDGTVLVTGGQDSTSGAPIVATAEIYNPTTGTFSLTNHMIVPRSNHRATLLTDGTVLITGGLSQATPTSAFESTAEIYNPTTGSFTSVGPMNLARAAHTSTLLPDGTVLIAGGLNGTGNVSEAEIYNPSAQTFTVLAATMTSVRSNATATLLAGATPQVLIAGGFGATNTAPGLNTAELYDPVAQTFTATTGTMTSGHVGHTATLLGTSTHPVLIAGGEASGGSGLAIAELYDPASGTFSATGSLSIGRSFYSATLLSNGRVLMSGGWTSFGNASTKQAEVYDPVAASFSSQGLLAFGRSLAGAALLPSGQVLIEGGIESGSIGSVPAEVYNPGP